MGVTRRANDAIDPMTEVRAARLLNAHQKSSVVGCRLGLPGLVVRRRDFIAHNGSMEGGRDARKESASHIVLNT